MSQLWETLSVFFISVLIIYNSKYFTIITFLLQISFEMVKPHARYNRKYFACLITELCKYPTSITISPMIRIYFFPTHIIERLLPSGIAFLQVHTYVWMHVL